MKCAKCGAEITYDLGYCPYCGAEVRIVPDYNPLDDMLAEQVRDVIGGGETSENELERYRQAVQEKLRQQKQEEQQKREFVQRRSQIEAEEEARRKKRLARRREVRRKKRRLLIGMTAASVGLLTLLSAGIYRSSYSGKIKKGYALAKEQKYDQAIRTFEKAVEKKPARAEAYAGLAAVYNAQEDLDRAEMVFWDAIEANPTSVELYEEMIDFYIATDQETQIPLLLDECEDESVLTALKSYQVKVPKFSLDESKYDEVQELTLTSKAKEIYYTIDGSEPTTDSTKYEEPISIPEGTTTVKAIAVNKKGVPSLTEEKTYTVELPLEDAPVVTPTTGQYYEYTMIEIEVPEGYEAYYTFNGEVPEKDSEDSYKYTEPIEMPEGNTLFSAVLIDKKGRASAVTKRNYTLTYSYE